MAKVFISADALRLVSKLLREPADTLLFAVKDFNINLNLAGEPWGDDDLGKQFSELYVPGLAKTQEAFKTIIDGLSDLSFDFASMALNYESVENNNNT